jgi:hypothetical protein
VTLGNKYSVLGLDKAHVGKRLRHFIDEKFLLGGYIIMFDRETVQTRNAYALFVKVLCSADEETDTEEGTLFFECLVFIGKSVN